jgi:hypothetical protein
MRMTTNIILVLISVLLSLKIIIDPMKNSLPVILLVIYFVYFHKIGYGSYYKEGQYWIYYLAFIIPFFCAVLSVIYKLFRSYYTD